MNSSKADSWVIDANIWIDLRDRYPRRIFETLWGNLSSAINEGRVQVPEEALAEINEKKGSEWFEEWKKEHLEQIQFETNHELIMEVSKITGEFESRLIDPNSVQKNVADPFIVGLAKLKKSIVVSSENHAKQVNTHVKIPDVCDFYGIKCMKLLDFIEQEIGKH